VRPSSLCSRASSRRICACTVTSRAETASSSTTSSGSTISARAIAALALPAGELPRMPRRDLGREGDELEMMRDPVGPLGAGADPKLRRGSARMSAMLWRGSSDAYGFW
jgi:hypothetical protein